MFRRTAVGGLVVLLSAATLLPAQAEPTGLPDPSGTSRFSRFDPDRLGTIVNLPQSLTQDKVVSALVELESDPVAVRRLKAGRSFDRATAYRRVEAGQDTVAPALAAAGATTYGRLSTVLNAFQVRVKVADLRRLAAVRGVRTVQVSSEVRPENSASNAYTGADRTWQSLGLTGRGQTIGIIDTGIDYTHVGFGGAGTKAAYEANDGTTIEAGSFPTAKVTGGYDFVGDDYDASSDTPANQIPQPDPDPLDCEGHGSHVAGTAAGAGVTPAGAVYTGPYDRATSKKAFAVEPGSAPEAKLKAYRVFGCEGSSGDDVIVAAIDRATSDGVDVINMSLGSAIGTADNLADVAIANATAAGVNVVLSAGNSGPGAYLVGGSGTSDTGLSVAASDNEFATFPGASIRGAATADGLVANGVAIPSPVTGELVDVGLGCSAADYAGVAGQIALTTRGTCDRVARAVLGQAAGAAAVVMINTDPSLPPFEGDIEGVNIPFVGVTDAAGPALLAADGEQVTLTAAGRIANPSYAAMADFSSNGPRNGDSAQKPDVTAPGVAIPSVAVGTGSGTVRFSGTSMATPHTAGVAALVRQAHPRWKAGQVKAVIMSTGRASRVEDFDSRRAGTGLVQPRRATAAQAYSWTRSGLNSLRFGLNELRGRHSETQSYLITNRSAKAISYRLSAKLSSSSRGADVVVSPRSLRVAPGQTRRVEVSMRLTRSDTSRLPGAAASDGGEVTTIHGRVLAIPRTVGGASPVLSTAFMFVPVPLSQVTASRSVRLDAGETSGSVSLRNSGVHTGTSRLYSWLLSDAAGDGYGSSVADLTNLGVQSLPGTLVGAPASDRLIVFAASQATRASTQSSHEVDVLVNTDADAEPEFAVFAADAGLVLADQFDGTVGSFVLDLATNELVAAYSASAPANGSTIEFPVLASDLGLTSASAPVTVEAAGFSTLEDVPADVMSGTATFSPYAPVVSQGDEVTLRPGRTATIPVTVDRTQVPGQTSAGWLLVTPDDRSGLAEADRIALVAAPASPPRVARR